jgi:hypothetical protein
MGEFEPVEHIVKLDGVDAAAKRAVLGETARRLLGGAKARRRSAPRIGCREIF